MRHVTARWVAFLGAAVAATLLFAAALVLGNNGHGPLADWVGVSVVDVEPIAYTTAGDGGDPWGMGVVIPWSEDGYCLGQFRVDVVETDREVRIGTVHSRDKRNAPCAGVGTVDGRAFVAVTLSRPLGDRQVVRESDGAALPLAS